MSLSISTLLKEIGIKKGDDLFIHSDIMRVPINLEKPKTRLSVPERMNRLMDHIYDEVRQVVGEAGTIIVPTYSYSFCDGVVFDLHQTPSQIGQFTEYIRVKEDAFRSVEPIHSVAAIGKNAEKFTSNIAKSCFGDDSIFDRLYKEDSWLVFLGTTLQPCTMTHRVEEACLVPYRFFKDFSGTIKIDDKTYEDTFTYCVRHLDRNSNSVLDKAQKDLSEAGYFIQPDSKHMVSAVKARHFFDFLCGKVKEDPLYFLDRSLD